MSKDEECSNFTKWASSTFTHSRKVWEGVSMDFITGLPKSKGYDAVMVVVDRLSKYLHFLLLRHPYLAKNIAALFVKEIIRLHGIPSSILSERDPIFISSFWKELFQLQGTTLRISSYHPETYGKTEVVNRCLESYFVASPQSNQETGHFGYHGWNYGTTRLFTSILVLLHLR